MNSLEMQLNELAAIAESCAIVNPG
jgi:hypothetical protein